MIDARHLCLVEEHRQNDLFGIFLCKIEARLSLLCKKSQIFGANAETINKGKWSIFHFDEIPLEYTGTLSIGKTFDHQYWEHDEKTIPVPFSPEVYKENGYIKLEKGKITEKDINNPVIFTEEVVLKKMEEV